jgi:DNA-binding response OmpR family regulator
MTSVHEQIQTSAKQDLGLEEKGSSVAIVSKSLLSRQSIARKLNVLGITVFEYRHFDALFQSTDLQPPDVVLIDTAAQELEWKALVSLLKIFSERTQVILLVSGINEDQAIEAARSGVAAIFVKPFKEEEHDERILDLLNQIHDIIPKRLQPRFTPNPETEVRLDYIPLDDWLVFPMEVRNISLKGAQLRLPYGDFAGELQPGSSRFPAILVVGRTRISLYLHVVHREKGTIGVEFQHLGAGHKVLEYFVRNLHIQSFGEDKRLRRW